jgi:tetratricopeptide (TPR) repeat protein
MIEELLADSLVAASRVDEAYGHYGEACTLRPNFAPCHYNMAEVLFTGHQLREALQQYQTAGRLTDKREMALSCLINSGEILLELGDPKAAEMELSAALQMDPNNAAALSLRQQAVAQGNGAGR